MLKELPFIGLPLVFALVVVFGGILEIGISESGISEIGIYGAPRLGGLNTGPGPSSWYRDPSTLAATSTSI